MCRAEEKKGENEMDKAFKPANAIMSKLPACQLLTDKPNFPDTAQIRH